MTLFHELGREVVFRDAEDWLLARFTPRDSR